jgi:hypothetical protein
VLIVIGIVFAVLGIMQFDQIAVFQAVGYWILDIGYWIVISISGYFVYTPILCWGNKYFQQARIHWFWRLTCLSVITNKTLE